VIMIAQPESNCWSQLLTSVSLTFDISNNGRADSGQDPLHQLSPNVSNPAQNRQLWPVTV